MTALALAVGCEFEFESSQAVAAVMQVAPSPQPGVRMRRETWGRASIAAPTNSACTVVVRPMISPASNSCSNS